MKGERKAKVVELHEASKFNLNGSIIQYCIYLHFEIVVGLDFQIGSPLSVLFFGSNIVLFFLAIHDFSSLILTDSLLLFHYKRDSDFNRSPSTV